MFDLNGWDLAVIGVAAYVSIMALVKLMARRRDAIIDELSEQVARERELQRIRKHREDQRLLREKMREKRRQNAA